MESQTFEKQPQTPVQQSRPQSENINALSRSSRAEPPRNPFLLITLCLGFSSWLISLVSQAIIAATFIDGNAAVRLLWFGIVIQFILLVEILEVVITHNTFAYGVQISIFAGLATVFAVIGADQNIYASSPAEKAVGAGWIITAIIDLLWIIYFTSPSDSHFTRSLKSSWRSHQKAAEHVQNSQDVFVTPPQNGSTDPRSGADGLNGVGLNTGEYATLAPGDIDKLKEEEIRGPERTSGYNLDNTQQRGSRNKSTWSNYTPSSQQGPRTTVSSEGTDAARSAEKENSVLGSKRQTLVKPEPEPANLSPPQTPSQHPPNLKATHSRTSRTAPQPSQPPNEAQWRAEALFDYAGAPDDHNELSFKKGEHLAIIDKSGKWWEAETKDGRKGIVPSNYLRLLI